MNFSHFSKTTTTTMLMEIDKDLEEQVNDLTSCPICMEPFENPKVLPCQHTFCLSCIQAHYVACNKQRMVPVSNFPCPTCRGVCYVPPLGLSHLPGDFKVEQIRELMRAMTAFTGKLADSSPETSTGSNGSGDGKKNQGDGATCAVCRCLGSETPATNFCAQCSKHFCSRCSASHCSNPVFSDHSVLPISPASTDAGGGYKCEEHQTEMTYYCERCATPACMLCVTCSHEGHDVISKAEAVEKVRRKTNEYAQRIDEKGKEFEIKIEIAKRLKQEHSRALKEGEKSIKKAVKDLEQKLRDVEKQTLVELKTEYESKVQTVSASEKLFLEKQKQVKGLSVELGRIKSNKNINLVLQNFSTLEAKINNELASACDVGTNLFEYACFKQDLKVGLGSTEKQIFVAEQQRAQKALKIELSKSSTKNGSETKSGRLKDFRNSFRLTMKQTSSAAIVDQNGNASSSSLPGSPKGHRSSFHGDTESGKVRTLRRQQLLEKLERRLSNVTGLTPSPGGTLDGPRLSLSNILRGSPTAGRRVSGDQGHAMGRGFAGGVDPSSGRPASGGQGLTGGPDPSRVRPTSGAQGLGGGLNLSGARRPGSGQTLTSKLLWKCEGFVKCRDCCFTTNGELAVTEYGRQGRDRLKIYSSDGELLHAINTILISEPWGICYNHITSSLVVTDHGGTSSSIKNIKIASTSQVASYTCVSSSERPTGVSCLKSGMLVMTDTGSKKNRVGVYSILIPGRFTKIREFGERGAGEGEILTASYVTVDSEDRIVVSDTESKCVKIFSPQGKQLTRFTSEARSWLPHGVTVDQSNNIYVSDHASMSVLKFSPEGHQIGVALKARSLPWGLSYDVQNKRLAVAMDSGADIYQI